MGMYTELVLKTSTLVDIPDQVHAVLRYLFAGGDVPSQLPDHPFFRCSRWGMVGRSSSFYHSPFAVSRYENPNGAYARGGYIFSRSDLKNYEGEIGKFLDWVDPYLDELPGFCIGWVWYEEDGAPTLVFKK